MGWLFGKKKIVPRVPFPEARPLGEGALRLPNKISSEKIIEPEDFKAAAGFEQLPSFPEELSEEEEAPQPPMPLPGKSKVPASASLLKTKTPFPFKESEPLFIKVEVYQRILGELEGIKTNLNSLYEVNRHLDSSEYNEEHNFEKMKKDIKAVHDRLLQIDKIIFKA